MKIIAISDLHGNLPNIPECDVLVIAGDVCPDFLSQKYSGSKIINYKGETRQADWLKSKFEPWLKERPAKHIIGIAGNHDFVFEQKFLVPKDLSWTYLEDSEVIIEGVKFYGTPWVPDLEFWAFYQSNNALEIRASVIPEDTNVLITHGPPFGFGDIAGPKYGSVAGNHVGDQPLLNRIEEISPSHVICGHIHEGRGEHRINGDVTLHNVSYVDETYTPFNLPFVEINI